MAPVPSLDAPFYRQKLSSQSAFTIFHDSVVKLYTRLRIMIVKFSKSREYFQPSRNNYSAGYAQRNN